MNGNEQPQRFGHRALVVVALAAAAAALLLLFRHVAGMLLLLFAGVLLAVGLEGLTVLTARHTPLGRRTAGVAVALVLVLLLGGLGWLRGPQLAEEFGQLVERLPQALDRLYEELIDSGWGQALIQQLNDAKAPQIDWAKRLAGLFQTVFGALLNIFVVMFVALYLWVSPSLYTRALVRLIPPPHRRRAEQILGLQAHSLRRWLLGRLASMLVVGVLTALGLSLLGVPLAITLGFISGALSFVPYLGPVLSAVPAGLIALLQGPSQLTSVLLLYGAVQLVESYMITPLIQQRVVSLPPAFLIGTQLIGGVLAGPMGVLLAAPLAVVVTVLVQTLYVEDLLGDRVKVLGE